jgi:hypothetical protein
MSIINIQQHFKNKLISPIWLVSLLLLSALYIFWYDPSGQGLFRKGALLYVYHLCRICQLILVALSCYIVGYKLLTTIKCDPVIYLQTPIERFIICLFLGATVIGSIAILLGLVGALSAKVTLPLTCCMLLIMRKPFLHLLDGNEEAKSNANRFNNIFALLVTVACCALVLTRLLYIPVKDANIWEHYLPYFRSVLESSSTQPSEIWHHFYASKAGGLILFLNSWGDVFSVQIISTLFFFAAALIIFDLLNKILNDRTIATAGVLSYLIYLSSTFEDGAAFKHHASILGYMSVIFWCCYQIQNLGNFNNKIYKLSLYLFVAYLGFYYPIFSALLSLTFGTLLSIDLARKDYAHIKHYFYCIAWTCAGGSLVLAINFYLTGLLEVTPMRLLWQYADQLKTQSVFGTGGLSFFLKDNNDLSRPYDWSFRRIIFTPKLPVNIYIWSSLLLLGAAVSIRNSFSKCKNTNNIYYYFMGFAFIFPICLLAQIAQTPAVNRASLYTIIFCTILLAISLKTLLTEALRGQTSNACHEQAKSRSGYNLARAAVVAGLLGLSFYQAKNAMESTSWASIVSYFKPTTILAESIARLERENPTGSGIGVKQMLSLRKNNVLTADKILRLTYGGGFTLFMPEGLVSEPTYSLVADMSSIYSESPDKVIQLLDSKGIKYFYFNLNKQLFSTFVFTSLFESKNINTFFTPIYISGAEVLLKIREDTGEPDLPPVFIRDFEIKRTGLLNAMVNLFVQPVSNLVLTEIEEKNVPVDFAQTRQLTKRTLSVILAQHLDTTDLTSTVRNVLKDIAQAGLQEMDQLSEGAETNSAFVLNNDAQLSRWISRLMDAFRKGALRRSQILLGDELAALSFNCNERILFARDSFAGATCY